MASTEKYVTEVVFLKTIDGVKKDIKELHQKVDKLAILVLNDEKRMDRMEQNMATKDDVNLILNRIDAFVKPIVGVGSFQ